MASASITACTKCFLSLTRTITDPCCGCCAAKMKWKEGWFSGSCEYAKPSALRLQGLEEHRESGPRGRDRAPCGSAWYRGSIDVAQSPPSKELRSCNPPKIYSRLLRILCRHIAALPKPLFFVHALSKGSEVDRKSELRRTSQHFHAKKMAEGVGTRSLCWAPPSHASFTPFPFRLFLLSLSPFLWISAVNCSAMLDEPYDEGLHIAAVFVILVASAAGACFPGAMALCGKKLNDQIIGCMRLFAAGWQEV